MTTQAVHTCAEPGCTSTRVQPVDDRWYCSEHAGAALLDRMRADREVALHPDLMPWVAMVGPLRMLKHPWVYTVLLAPGDANRMYAHKRATIERATAEKNWHTVVWAHERPYRLRALLSILLDGQANDPDGLHYIEASDVPPITEADPDLRLLALAVWSDAENIAEDLRLWRALFDVPDGTFLTDDHPDDDTDDDSPTGHHSTRQWFEDLPDPVRVYRGGISGDWSWTTDRLLAAKFAEHGVQRSIEHTNFGVRTALVPKTQVFGALTMRSESELLVRCTPDLWPLVHPDRPDAYDDEIGDGA